jgi:hypothetical protein
MSIYGRHRGKTAPAKKVYSAPNTEQLAPRTSQAKAIQNGGLEWTVNTHVDLSVPEMLALRREFKRGEPNWTIAYEVKRGIADRLTIAQIAFRNRGKTGYSERNIKRYHAPLLKTVGEGQKKGPNKAMALANY